MDSSRFDNWTKALTRTTSRRRAIKGLAATAIGGVLSLGGSEIASAVADLDGKIVTCGPVYGSVKYRASWSGLNKLAVMIWVGSDDIRQGNTVTVTAFMQRFSGWPIEKYSMSNGGVGYPNGSIFKGWIWLNPSDSFTYSSPNIRAIHIEHNAGGGDSLSADNWNMNKITVMYPINYNDTPPIQENSQVFNLVCTGSASPYLHRFKKSCDNGTEGSPTWEVWNPFSNN